MARKRSLDEGPVLRGQIIAEAAALFYERGYGSSSIRDIAEAAGISSSTMYHYFANKQEVLYAITSKFMTDFVAATVPVLRDRAHTPTARIRDVVRIHLEMSDDRRSELLVGTAVRYALNPEQRREVIKLQQAYNDAARDVIAEGCATGEFHVADVRLTTMAVLDMLNGVREWFRPTGPLSRSEIVDRYTTLVLKILGAR
jgi:AcrR family transcriptional regulator